MPAGRDVPHPVRPDGPLIDCSNRSQLAPARLASQIVCDGVGYVSRTDWNLGPVTSLRRVFRSCGISIRHSNMSRINEPNMEALKGKKREMHALAHDGGVPKPPSPAPFPPGPPPHPPEPPQPLPTDHELTSSVIHV